MLKQMVMKCVLYFFIFAMCSECMVQGDLFPKGTRKLQRMTTYEPASKYPRITRNKNIFKKFRTFTHGFNLTDDEITKFKLWPKGNIPYYIDVHSYSDKVLRDRIRRVLNEVNGVTSVNFLELPSPPKDNETRWVFFVNRRGLLGCADHSIKDFTNSGVQRVILGYDCMSTRKELPEAVLSIAGVPPQHNAPNRDDYIKVLHENIMPDKKYLFEKLKDDEWLFHDLEYDFTSAGHYHYHKYSVNGRATIDIQQNYSGISIDEKSNSGLSAIDIVKLKMLYNNIAQKTKDRASDCNKLFVRGPKFGTFRQTKKAVLLLKKPNKYLGLPEDDNRDNESKNSKEASDSKAIKAEENDEEKYANQVSQELDDTEKIKSEQVTKDFTDYPRNQYTIQPLKKQDKKNLDLLSYLSDYNTADEKKLKRLSNSGVQYMKFGPIG